MDLQINPVTASLKVGAVQQSQLAKTGIELFLGQTLKAVVLTASSNNEVLLNINGQSVSAKTSQNFVPGEQLDVKVVDTQDEIVLQVQQKGPSVTTLQKSILQNALLQTLPKQAPPTKLLDNLSQLAQAGKLPAALTQQIRTVLGSITPLSQLPQQLPQAISQSGVFLESALLQWQQGMPNDRLSADFKGQYLKLLESLPESLKMSAEQQPLEQKQSSTYPAKDNVASKEPALPKDTIPPNIKNSPDLTANLKPHFLVKQDTLPLPGAIPQPLNKESLPSLLNQSAESIQHVLREQVTDVLSRITANQINNLSQDGKNGFLIMLDLPIRTTAKDIDVVPLMIEQREATPTQPSQWAISFAVSLTELGDMQATVSLNSNSIDIKINAEKQQAIEALNEYHGEMSNLLEELGLNLRNFNLKLGLESNKIDVANLHLLDIRV